ncbi:hypothetical protein QAD02_016354 [Eretmocerus hayati]|uniref:Uncharacterized protein n=1 Tax=Eretmocerus hayati TaxID=131215 RepID=A0ACC2PAU9_9HYME|nr:hypothetical protein QAD02_016354 [Eretmocerus hayati]
MQQSHRHTIESIRRYLRDQTDYHLSDEPQELTSDKVASDSRSIGSLSQHLFDSDDDDDDEEAADEEVCEDGLHPLKCNGRSSSVSNKPGSKTNLLLCSECDVRKSHECRVRPRTPGYLSARFVEERFHHGCVEQKVNGFGNSISHPQSCADQRQMYEEQCKNFTKNPFSSKLINGNPARLTAAAAVTAVAGILNNSIVLLL